MTAFYIAIGIAVGALIVWLVLRGRGGERGDKGTEQSFVLMQNQMNELLRSIDQKFNVVDQKLGDSSKTMHESVRLQFGESQKLVDKFLKEVTTMTEKVTRVEETGKQMVSFADQLQSLQDVLKNPKQRGVLGEYYLETLLKNVLPTGSYQMQYPFSDGTIVDAAVFVKDKIIPIDSKFSLENYNRLVETRDEAERERLEKLFVGDLKNRIVETSKYIQPDRGTMDFAFMFIPHEAIYYDLLINKIGALKDDTENLIQRAAGKYHVIIVSPTSFLAYLQTVLQGLNALRIEETAKDIIKKVADLGKHLKVYEEYHNKLGNSLQTSVNHFINSSKEFKKVDKDVTRISGATNDIEPLILDKPSLEE